METWLAFPFDVERILLSAAVGGEVGFGSGFYSFLRR